ncbi:MAG: DivIVA domain-containing protein [Bacilli bacterium]|nr:DivIVA domain-containing protein [Bacilli bacterium]
MKKFSITLKGYDQKEVNKFVKKVTDEYEKMLGRLKKIELENISLKQELIRLSNIENKLNNTINLAEETSKIKTIAQNEADQIIKKAKNNASQIVNDALIRANEIEKESNLYVSKIKNIILEIEKQEY